MELDCESLQFRIVDALAGAVVGVGKADLAQLHCIAVHGVAVVLAGDVGADALHIPDRLVHASVAVFQLIGAAPGGQRRQLVAQADAEHGHLAQEFADLLDLVHVFRRISGAVGEHDAVWIGSQNVLRGGGCRQDRHGTAPLLEFPDDVALGAVIQQGHPELLLPFRRMDRGFLTGNGLHHAGDGVGFDGCQVGGDLIADGGIHHAVLPDDAGQLPGVHAVQPRHPLLFQEGVQIAVGAEVGGSVAVLPDHVALDAAGALEVLPDDAVVADEGIGLHDDLPGIAGICQCLDVAAHAGGEHQFPHRIGLRAEAEALKHAAIL